MPSEVVTTKGRQTRAAIEQAARKLFAERGFHGTTLADITSAAGKSAAVFYRYFDDKEDLLAALAELVADGTIRHVGVSAFPRRTRIFLLRDFAVLVEVPGHVHQRTAVHSAD